MIGVILEFKPLLYYSKFSAAYFEKDFLKVVFYINTGSDVTIGIKAGRSNLTV
jgi:hypothetical protein